VNWLGHIQGLPLLAKELTEQASRKRTYIIRSIYAIVLFFFAIMIFWGEIYDHVNSPLDLLGQGRQTFMILYVLQMIGIFIFTPALTCGGITSEKERNTIGLLFLTKLGPWTILTEKYLGRVFTMVSYLFISLPLFGFCYALGGVEEQAVIGAFIALLVTILQIGAIGVLCSCMFRTTVSAFIATYIFGFFLLFVPIFISELLRYTPLSSLGVTAWAGMEDCARLIAHIGYRFTESTGDLTGVSTKAIFPAAPTYASANWGNPTETTGFFLNAPLLALKFIDVGATSNTTWAVVLCSVPAFLSACFFFVSARLFLVWKAFAQPRNVLYGLFRWFDKAFNFLNNKFGRGVVIVKESTSLPNMQGIAWRETTKTPLGTFRYLIRVFIVLEFPVLLICLFTIILTEGRTGYRGRHQMITLINLIMWVVATVFIAVKSATLVSKERSHETLDVLLSTPISSRNFVRQKFKGVLRLMFVVFIPLATGILTQAWIGSLNGNLFGDGRLDHSPFSYLLVQGTCILIYFSMVAWMSFFIGLWMKTPTRAIFAALSLIVAWVVLPVLMILVLGTLFFDRGPSEGLAYLLLSSPAAMILFSELNDTPRNVDHFFLWLLNSFFYGSITIALWWLCREKAANMLGRAEKNYD